jgi:hypothetical protein
MDTLDGQLGLNAFDGQCKQADLVLLVISPPPSPYDDFLINADHRCSTACTIEREIELRTPFYEWQSPSFEAIPRPTYICQPQKSENIKARAASTSNQRPRKEIIGIT